MGEVSLACVLLIGAGLMLRSFLNLLRTDPGFRPEHVLTAGLSLPGAHYQKISNVIAVLSTASSRSLKTVPGVRAAGSAPTCPGPVMTTIIGGFSIERQEPPANEQAPRPLSRRHRRLFSALGIPLVRRAFLHATHDNTDAPLVIIINRAMARRYWGE